MMASYTYMSKEGVQALKDAVTADGEHLELRLNTSDTLALITALAFVYDNHEAPIGDTDADNVGLWSGDFLSSLAESYDIEFV